MTIRWRWTGTGWLGSTASPFLAQRKTLLRAIPIPDHGRIELCQETLQHYKSMCPSQQRYKFRCSGQQPVFVVGKL